MVTTETMAGADGRTAESRVAGAMRGATAMLATSVLALLAIAHVSQAQTHACQHVQKAYTRRHFSGLSVGVSDIGQLRDLALRPLLHQTRVPGTAGSRAARTHITTWMQSVGWTVEEDNFTAATPYGQRSFANVIATLNPGAARRVVLACHYDSKLMLNARFVGAIDSAVPCSLLMDTALRLRDVFSANHTGPTLQFIFFDGEEALASWTGQDSLYGSRHLAAKWQNTPNPHVLGTNSLQTIDAFILLDLIGTPDTNFKLKFLRTANVYNKLRFIEECLNYYSLLKTTRNTQPLFSSQKNLGLIEDDHVPFLERGVPIVHLITTPFPSVWHRPTDNMAALDFDRIENLARILRIFLTDLVK